MEVFLIVALIVALLLATYFGLVFALAESRFAGVVALVSLATAAFIWINL